MWQIKYHIMMSLHYRSIYVNPHNSMDEERFQEEKIQDLLPKFIRDLKNFFITGKKYNKWHDQTFAFLVHYWNLPTPLYFYIQILLPLPFSNLTYWGIFCFLHFIITINNKLPFQNSQKYKHLLTFIHVKCWIGWSISYNQDWWKKYQ